MATPATEMKIRLDGLWQQGRRCEADGDLDGARRAYEGVLELHAAHVPARLRMSRFEQARDRYAAARDHALAAADAVRLRGNNRLLGYVTLRLLDFAEEAEAAALILSADWQDPDVRRQAPTLAQHLLLCGRYADCLRFVEAMAAEGANAELALVHGEVMRALGHLEEARADCDTAIGLRPVFVDAHWTRSKLGGGDGRARAARLQRLLGTDALLGVERAYACYALFHELDRLDETAAAWEALDEGASLMRTAVRYDREGVASRLGREAGRPWLEDWARLETAVQPVPLFIVGLPRTGTTLLDRILGNHGWVSAVGERNDFSASVSGACGRFFGTLADERDPDALEALDWKAVGHAYLARMRRHASATAFALDKNPANLFNVPLILRALPQARILCLRRAPMDAAFSNLKELFHGGAYPYSYAFEDLASHVRASDAWMQHWESIAPASVRIVPYEDLVADPARQAVGIAAFCGLPPREALHEICRNSTPVATASSAQVREPIDTRSVHAWRRYEAQLVPLARLLQA